MLRLMNDIHFLTDLVFVVWPMIRRDFLLFEAPRFPDDPVVLRILLFLCPVRMQRWHLDVLGEAGIVIVFDLKKHIGVLHSLDDVRMTENTLFGKPAVCFIAVRVVQDKAILVRVIDTLRLDIGGTFLRIRRKDVMAVASHDQWDAVSF